MLQAKKPKPKNLKFKVSCLSIRSPRSVKCDQVKPNDFPQANIQTKHINTDCEYD